MSYLLEDCSREDFDNADILGAVNPHPVYGYFHGPIPYPKKAWAEKNDGSDRPHEPFTFASTGAMICQVAVDGSKMCGKRYISFQCIRRHWDKHHPYAAKIDGYSLSNEGCVNRSEARENAIKKWVLLGGWYDAQFVPEVPSDWKQEMHGYAEACERIAREDPEFRKKYGSIFVREKCRAQYQRLARQRRKRELERERNPAGDKEDWLYHALLGR